MRNIFLVPSSIRVGNLVPQNLTPTASTNVNAPSPAAGGGPAPAQFKKALPGLTAERLAALTGTLNQPAHEDAASLVNRAIEMWNQSRLAMCGSDDEREQLLKTLRPVLDGKEFVLFEQLAEQGEVPSRSKKDAIRTSKGVEKATLHYLETLRNGCARAFHGHLLPEDGVTQWKTRLQNLEQRCKADKSFPLCALENLQIFQTELRYGKAHKPTAEEIAAVLDLAHDLPRRVQIDLNEQPSKASAKPVKKKI